jgi:GNAT superfamily N-acetyltransferase
MNGFSIRRGTVADDAAAAYVCLKTGDHGADGEALYRDDPDALGRIYVGPYLAFEPDLSLILEDAAGVCGYTLGAFDSRSFFERYEREWRPRLVARFPFPGGDPATWTRTQSVHASYHRPCYDCPEPYHLHPSHLHIDLLERARGHGLGRRMMEVVLGKLAARGSSGAHVGVSARNVRALGFYTRLGFEELTRTGTALDGTVYLGKRLR